MLIPKKNAGLSTHVVFLLVVSLVMAFFLNFVLNFFYEPDPQDCQYYSYDVSKMCKEGKGVQFTITNTANKELKFVVNDKIQPEFVVDVNAEKSIRFTTTDSTINIMPYLVIGKDTKFCRGKEKIQDVEVLIKC